MHVWLNTHRGECYHCSHHLWVFDLIVTTNRSSSRIYYIGSTYWNYYWDQCPPTLFGELTIRMYSMYIHLKGDSSVLGRINVFSHIRKLLSTGRDTDVQLLLMLKGQGSLEYCVRLLL